MNKQIKRELFKTLDRIYKVSKSVSKSFGLDTISLLILKGLIDSAKFVPDDSNKSAHDYIKKNNDLLDNLYKSCEESVKLVKAEHLSPHLLRLYIVEIKKLVNQEMNTNTKNN